MTGVFYFSSTGNSLYIAKRIADQLAEKAHYIPGYQGDTKRFKSMIIVSPVYSWGLPKHVYDFLLSVSEGPTVYVVLNFGGMLGGADYYTYQLAKTHAVKIRAVYSIKMPENFTLTFSTPSFYNRIVLKSAEKKIDQIIDGIKHEQQHLPGQKKTKEEAHAKNKANWHLLAADFSVNDSCVKCKKCISVCPADNIIMQDGTVHFLDQCVACLGCYHRCPQKAIVYKNKRKKVRYINPNICENDIGKDV